MPTAEDARAYGSPARPRTMLATRARSDAAPAEGAPDGALMPWHPACPTSPTNLARGAPWTKPHGAGAGGAVYRRRSSQGRRRGRRGLRERLHPARFSADHQRNERSARKLGCRPGLDMAAILENGCDVAQPENLVEAMADVEYQLARALLLVDQLNELVHAGPV